MVVYLRIVLVLAFGCLAIPMIGPLGARFGLWHFTIGFQSLQVAFWLGLIGFVAGLVGLLIALIKKREGVRLQFLVYSVVCIAVVAYMMNLSSDTRKYPFIHDITTDTLNPPTFDAILKRRGAETNPILNQPEVREQQLLGYPDIKSWRSSETPSALHERALQVAKDMGWEVVSSTPENGIVEATDTTFWFGFKDDVVIRIASDTEGGSVLDIRSVSRVGMGDVGKNAQRIRDFLGRL